ncbi:hypothetical protein IQ26_01482 [Mesorhizobium tianshanense]|uniref:Uncharacterized protein n=1 Tax=Mesorhizobium tianshanense TaxID=39844 RepID=A0A562P780_9HYPH|nr:hypothetical protein IQ26_01482 [Mesorhizobium tianshanense]
MTERGRLEGRPQGTANREADLQSGSMVKVQASTGPLSSMRKATWG